MTDNFCRAWLYMVSGVASRSSHVHTGILLAESSPWPFSFSLSCGRLLGLRSPIIYAAVCCLVSVLFSIPSLPKLVLHSIRDSLWKVLVIPNTLLGIVPIPKQADPDAILPQWADQHLTSPIPSYRPHLPPSSILQPNLCLCSCSFCVDFSSLYFFKVIFNCQNSFRCIEK